MVNAQSILPITITIICVGLAMTRHPKGRMTCDMARKEGCPLRENMLAGREKETREAKEGAKMKQYTGWQ